MKIYNSLKVACLLLTIVVLCICSFGCADDNQQIRSVIEKFYQARVEYDYSKMVRYTADNYKFEMNEDAPFSSRIYIDTLGASGVEILFSEIDVREDFATAYYKLRALDENGEGLQSSFKTDLVKEDGKWKMKKTGTTGSY